MEFAQPRFAEPLGQSRTAQSPLLVPYGVPGIPRRDGRGQQGEEHYAGHHSAPPVYLAPVADPPNEHGAGLAVNPVENPVVTRSQPEEVWLPLEGFRAGRCRIGRKGVDPERDPAPHVLRELPEIPDGRRLQVNGVGHGLQPQVLLHLRPRDPPRLLQGLPGGLQVDPVLQLLE